MTDRDMAYGVPTDRGFTARVRCALVTTDRVANDRVLLVRVAPICVITDRITTNRVLSSLKEYPVKYCAVNPVSGKRKYAYGTGIAA